MTRHRSQVNASFVQPIIAAQTNRVWTTDKKSAAITTWGIIPTNHLNEAQGMFVTNILTFRTEEK